MKCRRCRTRRVVTCCGSPFYAMSNASRSLVASDKHERVGPDYFGYYSSEVVNLLSQDEDVLPVATQTSELLQSKRGEGKKNSINHSDNSSGSLYSNGVGAGLSDFKKDRLRSLLRQSVTALSSEVDEVVDPVFATYRLQSRLRSKTHSLNHTATASDDVVQIPCKKLKLSSSSSSASLLAQTSDVNPQCNRKGSKDKCMDFEPLDMPLSEKGISNMQKSSAYSERNALACQKVGFAELKGSKDKCMDFEPLDMPLSEKGISNMQKSSAYSERNALACQKVGFAELKGNDSHLGSDIGLEKENGEVNDDLQFLLENDSVKVEEMVKKYSNELSGTLGYMEQQLELLLDAVMSKCRPMTLGEKQQLQRLIQKLPTRNLDRVVEIICRSRPVEEQSCDKIFVDLEKEDNATLWRLYYYVEAVEKAKILSCSQEAQFS